VFAIGIEDHYWCVFICFVCFPVHPALCHLAVCVLLAAGVSLEPLGSFMNRIISSANKDI